MPLASLSAAAMKVAVPLADAALLVINQSGTRLMQNDGAGNTFLQLKLKERRKAQTETVRISSSYVKAQRSSLLLQSCEPS